MKKIIFSLFITFTLLIFSNNESIAQCPSGFTLKTVPINYLGCTYIVEFCYRCDPTYPGEIRDFKIVNRIGLCSPASLDAAIQYIRAYITSATFVFTELCIYNEPGPCEKEAYYYLESEEYYCYYEKIDSLSKEKPIYPCDTDDFCLVTYRYCFKNGIVHKEVFSFTPEGTIPSWKKCPPFDIVKPGECFMVQTLCNP